ncbi:ribose-5-phosphate isomerase RpiA [Afifella sp. IM 167]|uniref:ribose-5-phosphate isomerase RpiA n=1 Tax=Afifella sp. IM 167 TaxID=2033586 RepID=UPI001CCB595D|nr:ribose-5-phosphate isomerase RpiA [Afifella sp. IM 167]MBZ8134180.1 ribose 5-phosphate isomerase A [Afifella sp. IM 167]
MSDDLKREAAATALEAVEDGMRLGLGTGSTAAWFVRLLGEKVRAGLNVVGVPTSEATRRQAEEEGIALTSLDEIDRLDLTVDGADEVGPDLALVKGGGGALLREKIVAAASDRMIVVADASKDVPVLGAFPLPIEVVRFGVKASERAIADTAAALGLSGPLAWRMAGGERFLTDEGHYILDASFGRIPDPQALADGLAAIPGVVEHGLFLGLADEALIATPEGIKRLSRTPSRA